MNTTDLRRQAEQAENTPYKRVDVKSSVLLGLLDQITNLEQSLEHADGRATAAEALNERLMDDINGPTHMGEPVIPPRDQQATSFQSRVRPWLIECFGEMIAGDREERNHRFLEESLELVQSLGCSCEEAHQLVDYVFGREVGVPAQEVGGVMVTLAALCLANKLNMHTDGETELARITQPAMVEKIRAKQAAKPQFGPLPGVYPERNVTEPQHAARVPAQYAIVPIVPTPEMLEAGATERVSPLPTAIHSCRAIYTAMLGSAPTPPAQEG